VSFLLRPVSHTHGHALFDRVDRGAIDHEIGRSVDLIGGRHGLVAEHFAYPTTPAPPPVADAAVRRRYREAIA